MSEKPAHAVIYVLTVGRDENKPNVVEARELVETAPFTWEVMASVEDSNWLDTYNYQIRTGKHFLRSLPILTKIKSVCRPLGDHMYVNYGAQVSSAKPGMFSKSDVVSERPVGNVRPFVDGKSIESYLIRSGDLFLDYRQDEMYGPRVPELFETEKLLVCVRTSENERLAATLDANHLYCDHTVIVVCPYHAIEGTGLRMQFEGYTVSETPVSISFVTALVNSSLMSWIFQNEFATGALQGSYSDVWPQTVRSFPIRQIPFTTPEQERQAHLEEVTARYEEACEALDATRVETDHDTSLQEYAAPVLDLVNDHLNADPECADVVHDLLAHLAREMTRLKEERHGYHLDVVDYVGAATDNGPTLPQLGGRYQPASGVSDSLLAKTTTDLDNLRVRSVWAKQEGNTVTVHATARYKPEDPEAHDTDRWGYTESAPIAVCTLHDCTEAAAGLIVHWLRAVDDRGTGFADYRDNATQTMSLLNRLHAIRFPNPETVSDRLTPFLQNAAQAARLDARIGLTDRVIDLVVYRLYGLSEEEVGVVEENKNN